MKVTIDLKHVKKIFILEDMDNRIEWFKRKFMNVPTIIVCKKAGLGLEALKSVKYDIIFLDHDLEEDSYTAFDEGREPPKEVTGLYVAEELRNTINKETTVIVHSMNPIGAANMVKAHPFNTVHIPFHLLINSLEVVE